MKTTNLLKIGILAFTTTFFMACGGGEGTGDAGDQADSTQNADEQVAEKMTYAIDTNASTIEWKGRMLGGLEFGEVTKSHFGTLQFNNGKVTMAGDQITGGSFEVDMKSIVPKDDNYTKEQTKEMLVGHLMSADFFKTEEYPTSTLEIQNVEGNTATGTLTIRGKSGEVAVKEIMVMEEGGNNVITASLTFDRQDYDVAFEMPVEDLMVADDISLDVKLVTKK